MKNKNILKGNNIQLLNSKKVILKNKKKIKVKMFAVKKISDDWMNLLVQSSSDFIESDYSIGSKIIKLHNSINITKGVGLAVYSLNQDTFYKLARKFKMSMIN